MVIVYTRPDGGVSVVHPVPGDAMAAIHVKDVPQDATNVRVCAEDDLPPSRRFRNCWRDEGELRVDMPLARAQRMNEIRKDRIPKLAKSDLDLLKAQERGETTLYTRLKAYRQALRDVPQTQQASVDACMTPEQLEAWAPPWPTDPAP